MLLQIFWPCFTSSIWNRSAPLPSVEPTTLGLDGFCLCEFSFLLIWFQCSFLWVWVWFLSFILFIQGRTHAFFCFSGPRWTGICNLQPWSQWNYPLGPWSTKRKRPQCFKHRHTNHKTIFQITAIKDLSITFFIITILIICSLPQRQETCSYI